MKQEKAEQVHQQCALAVDSIIKNSLLRHSLDNVTSVLIAFNNFKKLAFPDKPNKNVERAGKRMIRNKSAHKESRKLLKPFLPKKDKETAPKIFPQSVRANRNALTFGKPKLLKNYNKHL
eukprot:TRINITY_DN6352_c0_g1_i1.p1 TRINITY_DN6352_c0_g1~~TRINITY_DN6352_c0_g1_i1.p1  ORF type:complete len:120 (+),score=24.71 TRINITY_DN6352_c0_g1_i1:113-472(+)